ncbi:ubiquinol--cytochrome-c reductase subunit 6 [Kickxella alabastrina]|uniref:Ubiquinol--cytochrome-c reductase subunit 6 n=1 Tax=Kickxella alabastrina TaxID=61397 RepID=A0ACC1IWM4_9FUNG|nr:ubiquinol--cytochrome-c reductase subunit 6 [Kickxella alabastrina]
MSIFDLINPFNYITPIHAEAEVETAVIEASEAAEEPVEVVEEEIEEVEEEEEEEEEAEDQAPAIKEACGETIACKSLKHHLEECATRVEEGSSESCAEELLHFLHCVDQCAVPKIFATLK